MLIAENLKKIRFEVAEACGRAGRDPNEVVLIAVSKTKPSSQILEAIKAKQFDFGENYVQEAIKKIAEITLVSREPARWHFIGSLQSNKVHQVVGAFSLIHSVDRLSLAQAISKEAVKKNLIQDILIQINVADEKTKAGVSLEMASQLFDEILSLKNLSLRGLMCLPPMNGESEKDQRQSFQALKSFAGEQSKKLSPTQRSNFNILSMGTSHDFVAAILEGATHIRIGTAIFGARENRNDSL